VTPEDQQVEFDKQRKRLIDAFLSKAGTLSELEVVREFEQLIYELILAQRGIKNPTKSQSDDTKLWAKEKMAEWNTYKPNLVHSQKALNQIGKGSLEEAIKYLNELESHRKKELSEKQSQNAKQPRTRDQLSQIISYAVKKDPEMNTERLITKLQSIENQGVIIKIDDQYVEYYPYSGDQETIKAAPISGLPSRITRAKKEIN